jgi:hypothetical protein
MATPNCARRVDSRFLGFESWRRDTDTGYIGEVCMEGCTAASTSSIGGMDATIANDSARGASNGKLRRKYQSVVGILTELGLSTEEKEQRLNYA